MINDLGNKIRLACKSKNIALKDLAENIGISPNGLQGILKNNSTTIEKLLQICNYLELPVSYFFMEDDNSMNNINIKGNKNNNHINISETEKISALKNEIAHLKKQLQDKDEIIRLLKELNSKQ